MDGMSHIQDCLDQLANGDLTCRADAKVAGELAQAFNRGVDALNEVLRSVDHSTHSVAERGTVIADQAMTLSHGTTEQAATIADLQAPLDATTGILYVPYPHHRPPGPMDPRPSHPSC